jgi:hypothetical protein
LPALAVALRVDVPALEHDLVLGHAPVVDSVALDLVEHLAVRRPAKLLARNAHPRIVDAAAASNIRRRRKAR